MENRLLFSDPIPASIVSENMYVVNESGRNCRGYISLDSSAEVLIKKPLSTQRRFPFIIKDADVELTFFADSDPARQHWMEVIQQAIDGTRHVLDNPVLIFPNYMADTHNKASMFSSTGPGRVAATDFPHKAGYMKKISTGTSAFGLNKTVKRWFRLEGGELRYYEDEDIRPSKLKSTLDLRGAKLNLEQSRSGSVFHLELSSGRVMRLEAPSASTALEWKDALSETLALLENLKDSKGEYRALRRYNLHEKLSAEEKREVLALMRGGSSKSQPNSPVRRSNSLFSSGNSPPPPPSSQSNTPPSNFSKLLNRSSSQSMSLHDVSMQGAFKTPQTVELLMNCLQQHFLLKGYTSSNDFNPILDKLHAKMAVPGEVILWQGSSGDLFYILEKGVCEVLKDNKRVALLQAGKSFGEMALLNSALRQATIRATEVCRLWCLSRKDFRDVANKHEQQKLQERMAFLRQIDFFDQFVDSSLEKIAEVMALKSYQSGEKIVRQGDTGDCFYMIATGRVLVTQQTAFSTSVVELVRLGPFKYFGELALIEDAPRKATVAATTAVTCWTIDRHNFKHLFGSLHSAVNENISMQVLKKVKLLETLSERHLAEIAKAFVNKEYAVGEAIIKQGDPGDAFYVLASGQVSVQVNHVQVAVLESGAFFGEIALLSNEKRSASVYCLSEEAKCLVLSRADFNALLGPLDELLQAEAKRRQEMQVLVDRRKSGAGSMLGRLGRSLSDTFSTGGASSERRDSITGDTKLSGVYASTNGLFRLAHLEKIRKLGVGTFGTVYLVQHTPSSKMYAMKMLQKEHLFTVNQERCAYTERDVLLILADSPFVPPLYATLQDEKCLYFVQQYVSGGDLFSLLTSSRLQRTKTGGIPVSQAVFYGCNILAALQHMHNRDVIYRDLKPENMLIDVTGYIKLADYGSARICSLGDKAETLCGTPEYISPEMILSKSYNRSVDFWGLGVFLFELLTRRTPFAHPNLVRLVVLRLFCSYRLHDI